MRSPHLNIKKISGIKKFLKELLLVPWWRLYFKRNWKYIIKYDSVVHLFKNDTSYNYFVEKGYINKVVTTNLTYLPPVLYEKPYFVKADMSKFLALIIDSLNHDVTIGSVMNPTDKIHALLEKHKKGLV